ncbi:MAG: hypothetical protein KIT14_04640 [bacterium]|nr:hypothetical protein [bacterium]
MEAHAADDPSLAFFARTRRVARAAIDAAGAVERTYAIAGHAVTVRAAGAALADLLGGALAQRRSAPAAAPALVVECWDGATSGLEPPPFPWSLPSHLRRGELPGATSARIGATLQPQDRCLGLVDRVERRAVWWAAAAALPVHQQGSPLRDLLHAWLADAGLTLTHAAAVGRGGRCVLLPGRSGSGKSTTALAALAAGFDLLGDDYVVVDAPARTAHALYSFGKLTPDGLARLPALAPDVVVAPRGDEKALVDLRPRHAARLPHALPIAGVVLPRITGTPETRAQRGTAGAALAALAPSTVFQLPGGGGRELAALAGLVRTMPVWELQLGTTLPGVAAALDAILAAT